MALYEVAILEQTKNEKGEGVTERLVFGPHPVTAKDRESAIFAAVVNTGIEIDSSRMVVLVRPFV